MRFTVLNCVGDHGDHEEYDDDDDDDSGDDDRGDDDYGDGDVLMLSHVPEIYVARGHQHRGRH